ncbi:MAG: RNA methyltransferase [Deltaproteobacteria bacterium]|nr:RNA methyltransferase [Deltaproteobacteria bacterium]
MSLRSRVDFVLVEPSEAGNVGSCARALANTGVGGFALVRPRYADPEPARTLAVHAAQLVDEAPVFDSLEAAVARTAWVVGVSGRPRAYPERKPPIGPADLVTRLDQMPSESRAALVFGPERCGLTNAQLGLCQDVLCLASADSYPSYNLAHAVLLVAWELLRADRRRAGQREPRDPRELATAGELDGLMNHARRTLGAIGYLNPQNPRLALDELRKVFARADLDPRELRMLRGIFHRMDVWIAAHGGPPTPNENRGELER